MVQASTSESIVLGPHKPNEAQETDLHRSELRSPESKLKEITVSFVRRTKIHGLKFIFCPTKSRPQQIIWSLAFCLCISLLCTWSWNRILYLSSYPAITKIYMVWAHNMSFPAVTFCNKNVFRVSTLTKEDLYHSGYWMDLLYSNHTVIKRSMSILKDSHKPALLSLLDFQNYTPPSDYRVNTTEMMGRLGHQLEDMLLECRFRGDGCTHKNFSTIYTRYGKCYTFNSGLDGNPLLTTLKGGTGNGLEIMLDIQQDEYLPVWGETDETSYEAGIKVQLHSQSEPPFLHELGFGVAPGFQTFVSTQEQRLQYLPPPWGDCKSTPIDSEFFSTYSITACRIDCETRYLLENCNCRMVHMPGTSTVCTPEQYKECADPALDFLVEKDNDYCVCQTPCNMTRYGKELSMVKIPSKASAKYLAKKFNKTEQYIGDNILVLDIFFEALNYEKIEQKKAYEIAGLLGDIGGQMGLFIGASVLTILEIFDYLYEVFKDKVLGYFMRKKRPQRCQSDNLEFPENPTSPGVTPNHAPRAPVIPSGVTRIASDSRRTSYLVTRL
ncbi:acid-sensing ion channel 1C isoform X2 [Nothobranchius furzeri]|uniref:Transcript variant X2 n=2 Tax=Nothobranchius furzeri TaxID=105023 RepID=A0A9D3BW37_NOTFU|nr:acid-sensing ion channel 1C isoform X2 [Nothobranchius furzeri]KAF7222370.1 transcript variant X2 [Nothobranchius furzeri]